MELIKKTVTCASCDGQGKYEEQLEDYAGAVLVHCDDCDGQGTR
jgi:DnaJ-class molecular chaperone